MMLKATGSNAEVTLLTAWIAAILSLFLLFCAGQLPSGWTAFTVAVLIGTGYFIWQLSAASKSASNFKVQIGQFIAPILMVLSFILVRQDFSYFYWDDLSHWARATKFIATHQALFTAPYIASPTYPPGLALMHYSALSVLGFRDQTALFIHFSFIVACMSAIVSPITRHSLSMGMASLFCILIGVFLFRFSLDDTTADVPMGLLLAVVCVAAYSSPKFVLILSANSVIIAFLVTVKQMGLPFALVGAAITSLAIATRSDLELKSPLKSAIVSLIFLIACAALPYWLWQSVSGASAIVARSSPLPGLVQIVQAITTGEMSSRFSLTLGEFLLRLQTTEPIGRPQLFGIPGVWGVSPIMMFVALTVISGFAALCVPARRVAGLSMSLLMAAGMLGYVALLFSLYLTHFTEYEGTAIASFERYAAGYFLAWAAFTLVMIFTAIVQVASRIQTAVLPVLLIGTVMYFVQPLGDVLAREAEYRKETVYAVRKQVTNLAMQVQKEIKPDEKVYFVKQGDTGFAFFAFQYEMMDNRVQDQCWSLGPPVNPGDIWSCNIKIEDALAGFSLLVLSETNKAFWDTFGDRFNVNDRGLGEGVFRIEWSLDQQKLPRLAFRKL